MSIIFDYFLNLFKTTTHIPPQPRNYLIFSSIILPYINIYVTFSIKKIQTTLSLRNKLLLMEKVIILVGTKGR